MDHYDFESELRGDVSINSGTVISGMRWVGGIIAAVVSGAMLLLLSCTYKEVTETGKDMASVKIQLQLKGEQYEREFTRIDARLTGHDQRLDGLEYQRRDTQPHPNRR